MMVTSTERPLTPNAISAEWWGPLSTHRLVGTCGNASAHPRFATPSDPRERWIAKEGALAARQDRIRIFHREAHGHPDAR